MLSKLLKKNLKKNMRWFWILFASTISAALITRGCKELGKNIAFFKMAGIFFDSVFYALAINAILQPFLRNFFNFQKSFYSDESYLTHTLPVTKNQLLNSKYLTALIEVLAGFATLIISILIMFASPSFLTTLKMFLSSLISTDFSVVLIICLLVILILVEFLMFLSIIYFGIVMGYKQKDRKVLNSFLISVAMAFVSLVFIAIIIVIVLLINGVKPTSQTLVLSNTALISITLTAIITYLAIAILFYFLTKREFNKGVNVD